MKTAEQIQKRIEDLELEKKLLRAKGLLELVVVTAQRQRIECEIKGLKFALEDEPAPPLVINID